MYYMCDIYEEKKQEAAISRKVTAQQVAAIRLIVQGLQLREVQKNV